jgi:cold shock CspA family protein
VPASRGGPRQPTQGVVSAFDEDRGLGTVVAEDGRRFAFHCAAIADGTRHITVGTSVMFFVAPGHGGQYEARHLARVGPGSS